MDPVEKPSECSPASTPEPGTPGPGTPKRDARDTRDPLAPIDARSAPAGELNLAVDGSAADDMDEARLKKLNHLKHAIADGTYHVPAEEVARKLIEHMLEPED